MYKQSQIKCAPQYKQLENAPDTRLIYILHIKLKITFQLERRSSTSPNVCCLSAYGEFGILPCSFINPAKNVQASSSISLQRATLQFHDPAMELL